MEKRVNLVILGVFLLITLTMGCASTKKALREDLARRKERIQELEKEKEALAKEKKALEKMRAENERIQEEFQDYMVKSEIEIREAQKGLVISFIDKVLFDSGRAEIKPRAYPVLEKVAQIIGNYPNRPVLIEGHTDNVPIGSQLRSRYQTNWELSTARAVTILRYLIEKHNLSQKQLAAAGYGEFHPIADNETDEGRQKNRRVEIVIMPEKITREQ